MIYELVMVWEESKRYWSRKKWIHGAQQNGEHDEVAARRPERERSQTFTTIPSTMKKYFPIVIALFFFSPVSAFADITVTPHSYSSLSDTISIDGGINDGWMSFFAPTTGSSFVWNTNSVLSGSTDYMVSDLTNQEGTFHILIWNNDLTDYNDANLNGTTYSDMLTFNPTEDITITFSSPSPPPTPPSGIDSAIAVATSSFKQSYGFDMDAVSIWMWENLGQPILGSGIGVLVVMKWYWLGLIAIGIIIFFCFAYFRFFKQ